jgi:hypothetical protein
VGTPFPTFEDSYPENDTVGISIDGSPPIQINKPLTLSLGGYTVYLNRSITTSHSVEWRSLEVDGPDLPGGRIIVADSVVSYSGNPCTAT